MIEERPSKAWIPLTVAIIGGVCAIIAAIVSGFVDRLADRVLPPLTQPAISANPTEALQPILEPGQGVETQPPSSQSNSGIAPQLDSIFSTGNWFCFPDRNDAVGVKVSNEANIESLIVKVDTYLGTYTSGSIPYGIGATVWLDTFIPTEECPAHQLSSIDEWRSARSRDTDSFDRSRMDALFGNGDWSCVPSFPYAVTVVNLPAGTAIQYPITAVDNASGRYGVGEAMPQSGSATVWLAGSIPQNDCP